MGSEGLETGRDKAGDAGDAARLERGRQPDFQRLFESAPGLYLVLNPDFVIVGVTDGYLAATKTERSSIIGRGLFEVFPDNPDDPDATGVSNLRDSLQTVLRTKNLHTMAVQKYDIRKPESEGGGFEERFWSCLNSPMLDSKGRVELITHRAEDVTEFVRLKQNEATQLKLTEEFRSKADRMEQEVFARAQEVQEAHRQLQTAHEQLSELYDQSRELDELKTQFFANVSHELRTPLTLILAPVRNLIKEERLTGEDRQALETIERNARLLLKHVNDLLDLSKLEAGRMTMRYSEIDLSKLVRLVGSHFQTSAEDLHIHYEIDTPTALTAQCDPEKVQRILLNLLSNALKFTPSEGTVRFALKSDGGDAVLSVEDSGPGIPSHMREAVFERFRQVDGNVTPKFGGTGLGLAIVREFTELHKGTVEVNESPLGGALFTVRLPRQAPDGTQLEVEDGGPDEEGLFQAIDELRLQAHVAVEETPPEAAGMATVLVVEDNPDMRAFLVKTLSSQYRVITATDGAEGVQKALQHMPDLILSDMMMPNMSGDRMVKIIRSHEELEDVPILLLTAKADETLRIDLLKRDVQDYLQKPFSTAELAAKVGRHIAERKKNEKTKAQLASIVESSHDAIFGVTTDGVVTSWNQGAVLLFGYDAKQAIGQPISVLVDPGQEGDLSEVLLLVGRGEFAENLDWLNRDHKGRKIDTFATVTPMKSPSGEVVGASVIVRDVRAQRKAEREVRQLNAKLEKRVEDRTREYEQANKELEAFSYSVSHDLRTPLRSIDGFSKILLEDHLEALDEDAQDCLNRIRSAAQRMGQLIEDLLMLSRLAKSELHREEVDLSELVAEIAEALRSSEPGRNVEFLIQPDVRVNGDGQLLKIALENLLGNSWKFTSRLDSAKIEFGIAKENGKQTFFVRDNGAGFDMAHSAQLFGAFQRLHNAKEFSGSGIGLATVQRIVNRHGGEISGEGVVNGGATFYFNLNGS